MNKNWVPALEQEVIPALPLHKNGSEWINAIYVNGERKNIHLKQLFLESKYIKSFSLGSSPSTLALYRIAVSIAYKLILMDKGNDYFPKNINEFDDFKISLIANNEGFSEDNVNKYFEKYDDRFYLIHPTYPFMQDPSLYKFYAESGTKLEDEDRRKDIAKKVANISNVHPSAPSTNNENGQKIAWGLPAENIFKVDLENDEKINLLMTSLLHNTYSHSATNRGKKLYENSMNIKNNDDYHKTHYYRCAIGYIPQGDSLFQTLIIPMEFESAYDIERDLPIWEEEPNSLGFLKYYGYTFPVEKLTFFDSSNPNKNWPRSSVNSTHLSMLFFPEFSTKTNRMADNGGIINQMRRILINLKWKDTNGKIPFPRSWNPFVAVKYDKDGNKKAFKQVQEISPKTSMKYSNLTKIPLFPNDYFVGLNIEKPFALEEYSYFQEHDMFSQENSYVNVLIFSGDASKDKTFADFSIKENSLIVLTKNKEEEKFNLDSWFIVGSDLNYNLRINVKNAISKGGSAPISDSVENQVSEMFWNFYSTLYNENVNIERINPVGSEKNKNLLKDNIMNIYENMTASSRYNNPLLYAKYRSILSKKIYNILEGK